MSTLSIADALNFLDSIAAVAEQEHRKQSKAQPTPSPLHTPGETGVGTEGPSDAPTCGEPVSATTEEMTQPHQEPELEKLAEVNVAPTPQTGIPESSTGGLSEQQQSSECGRGAVEDASVSTGDDDDSSSCCSESSEQSSSSGDETNEELNDDRTEETLTTESKENSSSTGAGRKPVLEDRQKKHRSRSKARRSKRDKSKRIVFYGMGAGSFPAMENL